MNLEIFENLYLKLQRRLMSHCLYITNNNFAYAEDLVQESFTRFFKKFFAPQNIQDEGVSSIPIEQVSYSYLRKIADNVRYEWYRKNHKFQEAEPIDESYEAQQKADRTDLDSQVHFEEIRRNCYLKLNQFERSIFFAAYFYGYSREEIAQRFSISPDSVKHRLTQAKNKLQSE